MSSEETHEGDGDDGDGMLSEGIALLVSAAVGFAVAIVAVWYVSGPFDTFYEALFRIGPTLEGGGVGADWVVGNTIPALDFLIALTHAADVIMGVFILFILFVHWGAFRRHAARMRPPEGEEEIATDGGERFTESRPSSDRQSDGGERPEGGEDA